MMGSLWPLDHCFPCEIGFCPAKRGGSQGSSAWPWKRLGGALGRVGPCQGELLEGSGGLRTGSGQRVVCLGGGHLRRGAGQRVSFFPLADRRSGTGKKATHKKDVFPLWETIPGEKPEVGNLFGTGCGKRTVLS